MRLKLFLAAAAILPYALCAHADTIASNTAGTLGIATGYFGQEFTSSGNFDDIAFSFYSNIPATNTVAAGTGFLLSQAYLGTPDNLSSSTAGFLGSASASGGAYVFNSASELTAGTTYFFYENAAITVSGGNAGQPAFFADTDTTDFITSAVPDTDQNQSSNFIVTGTPVSATPEPSSLLLLSTGLVGFGSALRRRFA